MNQTRTNQTKKKTTPTSATKPSSRKRSAATTRITTKRPQVPQEQQNAPANAISDELPFAPNDQAMQTIAVSISADVRSSDFDTESPIPETETSDQSESPAAIYEGEVVELPSTSQIMQMNERSVVEDEAALEVTKAYSDADPVINTELSVAAEQPREIVNSEPISEMVNNESPNATLVVGVTQELAKTKGGRKPKANLGERYTKACAEVSKLRVQLLNALNDKAQLLGVERKGEAVPISSVELDDLNAQIKATRQKLDDLLRQKRERKLATPELQEVSVRINRLRKERGEARCEKKLAYSEAVGGLTPEPTES